jgi:ABC-type dipeptide/oligopeptide/nickel transport system permease subunit
MTLGQLPPLGSTAGSGDESDDARDEALLRAAGAGGDPSSIELREVEGLSLGRVVLRRFLHHRAAIISLIVLVFVVILSFSSIGIHAFGLETGGWWMWNFRDVPAIVNGGTPTMSLIPLRIGDHPFGQDSVGHDMFAAVMRGIQQSVMIVFITGVVSTVVGAVLGAVAGYFGGWIDSILMRLTDMVIIVPLYLIAAIVGNRLTGAGAGGSFFLALLLGLLVWTTLARLVRGEVLALREREFVDAARVAGASSARIMFRHILPNSVGVIVVSATLTMSATILLETALSFIGFGVHAPDVSLGSLISEYQSAFTTRPWLFWWPGIFIVIIALSINFIGDGLRDAFDPRQRRGLRRAARREQREAQRIAALPAPTLKSTDA